jgi:hypothetical protein
MEEANFGKELGDAITPEGLCILASAEGDKFSVSRRVMALSLLVVGYFDNEADDEYDRDFLNEIPLPNIKTSTLSLIVEFCIQHYNDPMPKLQKPLLVSFIMLIIYRMEFGNVVVCKIHAN